MACEQKRISLQILRWRASKESEIQGLQQLRGKRRYTPKTGIAPFRLNRRILQTFSAVFLLISKAHAQEGSPIADDPSPPRNNYGAPGLIDMPSARMAPDGELSVGAFFTQNIQRYNLGFQAFPWLEASLRYSGLSHFYPPYSVYYDRSFSLKMRLLEESEALPSLAVGVNDIVGTGVYGGEYLVASKRFGTVDASLGIGWGRLGSTALFKNPLASIAPSFGIRPAAFSTEVAGGTNFNVLFHGHNVGLFGGLSWATPVDGLVLTGEYSSDAYSEEANRGAFRPYNQINLGASYQLTQTMTAGVSWLYGRAVGGNISFQLDPVHDPYPQRIGPPLPEIKIRTPEEQQLALERLMGVRGAHNNALSQSFADNRQLVDQLWKLKSLDDVKLNGHVISLSFTRGDAAALCRGVASVIGQYDTSLTSVNVSRGNVRAQCPIAVMPALVRVSANVIRSMDTATLANMSSVITLIHADGRTAASDAAAIAKIRTDMAKQQIGVAALSLAETEAIVYYNNGRYFSEVDAIGRLTRILTEDAPVEIEKFRLVSLSGGRPTREFVVLRAPLERTVSQTGDFHFATDVESAPAPMENPVLAAATGKNYPSASWFIFPQFRQQLFDPQNPLGVQFLAGALGTIDILPGLSINGQVEASLFDTFNTNRPPSSDLPHVRTDFLQYFTRGKNGIAYLDAEYKFRLAPTVFATVRAGYLESMFAGAGGEILWRPEGQRWALGVDAFDVQQRNFDRLFGLQNYRAFTGHVSLYYASPWYDLNFVLRAGQYLAHDRGLTLEITRRFSTGIEVGAFFTKTNVSAQTFGEGSFDKGIMLRIPLNWIAPIETQAQFNMDLRPVQRDGGQRLEGDASLFYETRRVSEEVLQANN
jgi:hypothetical protein